MKKDLSIILISMVFVLCSFSAEVTLKVTHVKPNCGKVFVSINKTAESFKSRRPDISLSLESSSEEIETVLDLEEGEYAFSIFQDLNGDGKINSSFIGIPKEPYGFTNYDDKGVPGNFNRHKVFIKDAAAIEIPLYKF